MPVFGLMDGQTHRLLCVGRETDADWWYAAHFMRYWEPLHMPLLVQLEQEGSIDNWYEHLRAAVKNKQIPSSTRVTLLPQPPTAQASLIYEEIVRRKREAVERRKARKK